MRLSAISLSKLPTANLNIKCYTEKFIKIVPWAERRKIPEIFFLIIKPWYLATVCKKAKMFSNSYHKCVFHIGGALPFKTS